jgi:hypothetical protein
MQKIKSQDLKLKRFVSVRGVHGLERINSEINSFLTRLCNGHKVLPSERKFLQQCLRKNLVSKLSFCYCDFDMTPNYFRQMVHRLKKFIKVTHEGRPTYYKIIGVPTLKNPPYVTEKPTGPGMLYDILEYLEPEQLKIHDVKMSANSDLHDYLKWTSRTPNKNNNGYKLNYNLSQDTLAKIMVYPKQLQIDIACSNKPLIYDISGILRLTYLLGMLCGMLRRFSPRVLISPLDEWNITHYHIGKDGSSEYSGDAFHMTFDEFSSDMVRLYVKKFPDGRRIRLEKIVTPQVSIADEFEKILNIPQ